MKRIGFLLSLFVLFIVTGVQADIPDANLFSENTEGVTAVVESLSEIPQVNEEFTHESRDMEDRIREMRIHASGKPVSLNAPVDGIQPNQGTQTNAPKLFRSFKGSGPTGFEPPDPNVAVGPDRVVVVVNKSIAVYTKLGQKIFQTTLRSFFGKLPDSGSVSIFYPKVIYDSYNKHFIVVIEAIRPVDKKSWYFVAVSKTDNPQGQWAFWELNMALNGTAPTQLFADYPGIGINQDAIFLTANMSNWNFRFEYSKIRVLKKSEVYKFGKVTWKDFFKITDAAGVKALSIQPAVSFGPAPSEYLVSSNHVSGSTVTLWNITNPTSPAIALSKQTVAVAAYEAAPDAQQKGGPLLISTGDSSIGNVVFRDGFVYAAHTVARAFGTKTVSAIRFYQIGTNASLAQEVTYASSGSYFYYPVTMVDSRGNVVIAFNRSSGGLFISTAFTGRKPSDPRNTLQPSATLKAGSSYYRFTSRQVQYWGEYNGIALDYDDSIWFAAAIAKAPTEWEAWIGKVSY